MIPIDPNQASESTPPTVAEDTPRLVLKPKPPDASATPAAAAASPPPKIADGPRSDSAEAGASVSQHSETDASGPINRSMAAATAAGQVPQPGASRSSASNSVRTGGAGSKGPSPRAPSGRKTGPPKKLVPEGVGQHAAQVIVARSFNPNSPKELPETMPPPPPAVNSSTGSNVDTRKRDNSNHHTANIASKRSKVSKIPAKKMAQRKAKVPNEPSSGANPDGINDGEISEEELTEQEELIDDKLVAKMEEVITAFGDEAIDGYVVWAKANGFPWWPAQLVTLEGATCRFSCSILP
eukprot:SAG31_NODE_280_length_18592_cov_33.584113_13_plen_296_part_00